MFFFVPDLPRRGSKPPSPARPLRPPWAAPQVAALQGPSQLLQFVAVTLIIRRVGEGGTDAQRAELVQ